MSSSRVSQEQAKESYTRYHILSEQLKFHLHQAIVQHQNILNIINKLYEPL